MQIDIGSTVKGYTVTDYLTGSEINSVYRAFQQSANREVALKVISSNHPEFIRRFETDMQAVTKLEHPYIVPVYDFWRDQYGAYLVMRLFNGGSLKDALKKQGTFSLEDATLLLEQVCQALHKSHRNQVIHGNLKPANILLDEDGNAYLSDFGITSNQANSDTMTTSLYISPEQAQNEAFTPQTDIYSLGVMLYEMLTGEHPFHDTSEVQNIFRHLNEPLPEITTLTESNADKINRVIQTATAKNPKKRYDDALKFIQALREVANLEGTISAIKSPVELLTPREQEVLNLIVDRNTNRQIAEALVVELSTVKWYVKQIYRKLGVRSRVQAIVKARNIDLITGKSKTRLGGHVSNLPEPENPYKGLEAFSATDSPNFFGRESLVRTLCSRLAEPHEYQRFLALVGPSGSGKSSVVKAGLIPAVRRGGIKDTDKWYVIDMLPGNRPLDELEVALYRIAGETELNLREHLNRDETGLVHVSNAILPDDGSELLIVIDQFEEIFTALESESTRQHMLDLIRVAVTTPESRVRIVVTIRADYYDRPLHYSEFGKLIRNRVETILPLSAEELERAISEPAHRVGLSFEEGLVSRILSDVYNQPGALPLMQYALTELFERREGKMLTAKGYNEIGGTGGALANRADELYLEGDEQWQDLIQQIFLRLVTLGEGAEDTRRRVEQTELFDMSEETDAIDEIIDTYANSRLISLDHDPVSRQPTVEVAHEAILREWDRLRQWLNVSRDDIRQQRELLRTANDWNSNNRDDSYLLRGTRLEQVVSWHENTSLSLTPFEAEFIALSVEKHERELRIERERQEREARLERRSRNFLRGLVVVMALGLFVAGLLAIVANTERVKAEQALDTAQRSSLAFAANSALDRDEIDLAIALAVESAKDSDELLPETLRILERISIVKGPRKWIDSSDAVCGPFYSLDGQYFLTSNCKDFVRMIATETGEISQTFSDPEVTFSSLTLDISPDNTRILTLNLDTNEASIWDVATGSVVNTFNVNPNRETIFGIYFAWDADHIVIPMLDDAVADAKLNTLSNIYVFDANRGDMTHQFAFDDFHYSLWNFSPDGELGIVSGWADLDQRDTYHAYVFEVNTGEIIETYERSANAIPESAVAFAGSMGATSIGFSDDMTKIYIGGNPNYIIDRSTDEDVLIQDEEPMRFVRRLRDKVTVGDNDELTLLFDTNTGEVAPFDRVMEAGFGNDEYTLVSMPHGTPGIYHIWDLSHRNIDTEVLIETFGWRSNAINAQKGLLASVNGVIRGTEAFIHVRDMETGEIIYELKEDEYDGFDLTWSPDGSMLVAGLEDGTIIIWEAETGEELHRLTDIDQPYIVTLDFTSDSRYLAAGFGNPWVEGAYDVPPYLVVWDTETGEVVNRIEFSPGEEMQNWGFERIRIHPSSSLAYVSIVEAYATEKSTYVVDILSGETVQELPPELCCTGVFTPDGEFVIPAQDGNIYVISLETGEILRQWASLDSHQWRGVDMTADGKYLVTGSGSRAFEAAISLWDFDTGELIRRFIGHDRQSFITDLDISPDGTQLVSASIDATSRLWTVDTTSTLDWVLENRAVREFNCAERELYRIEPYCES